ncbi:MAG: hypothetical protein FK734_03645 [Asgard group archaeon]|nr:hypothetical protein [Asgard group archaeon]
MSEILNSLQLSPTEEKVYLYLLATGQLSTHEIAELHKLHLSEVEEAVKGLIAKNLIYANPSIVKKYTAVYPITTLSTKAKDTLDTIQNMVVEINNYAEEKFAVLDQIVKSQKEAIHELTRTVKEEVRLSTESSTSEVTADIDKLIEEIGQILNEESNTITSSSMSTTTDLSKHFQETTEKTGNIISLSVRDIVTSLNNSQQSITKTFDESSSKIQNASKTYESSLHASLDNNFGTYTKILIDTQEKINRAIALYNSAAKDNMNINNQVARDSFAGIVDTVNTRLGTHDKQTNQILEERIRNITQSITEMNDEFGKVVRERLAGLKREYEQMIETFNRNVERMFTDSNTQLEQLLATKTKTNAEKTNNLFKILKDNLDKNSNETRDEIKAREVRLGNEMKSNIEITNRKMTEANEKLTMELTNSFNKAQTDFETAKNNMNATVSRAKTDIDTKFLEAKNVAITDIGKEFKNKEENFTSVGSKVVEQIRILNNDSEIKAKNFVTETSDNAKEAIGKIEMPAKTLLNRGKQTAVRYINEQAAIFNKAIDQAQVGIEDTIIAETSEVKNQFKGYGDKYKDANRTIERLLSNLELTYRELLTKVKDIPRPELKTMTILGKDAVLKQIKDIFGRIKTKATIVYPEINDIHMKELLESNPRTRVIIISDFDPFKNADIIKKLMSKENIQLKSLAIGATEKPYYAIGRDTEECLVGSVDDSGEVVAITSDSKAFVEMVNTEFIGSIITPKTKRVSLEENNQI